MDRTLFVIDIVQHVGQGGGHVLSEQSHGVTRNAVGEASLNHDYSPAVIGFLNGAIDGVAGDQYGSPR